MVRSYRIKIVKGKPYIIIYDDNGVLVKPLIKSEQDERDVFISENVLECLNNEREELLELLKTNKKDINEKKEILAFIQGMDLMLGLGSCFDKKFFEFFLGMSAIDILSLIFLLPNLMETIREYRSNKNKLEIINIAIEMFEGIFELEENKNTCKPWEYPIREQYLYEDTNCAYKERLSVATEAYIKMKRNLKNYL